MKHCLLGIVIPVVLAGCTSPSPTSTENNSQKAMQAGAQDEQLSKALKQLPRDLRPEDLEKRDDTTVIIREGTEGKIREYRIGGILYGIKVIPKNAPPYFLVPASDPGFFIRPDKPERLIPSWQVFSWK